MFYDWFTWEREVNKKVRQSYYHINTREKVHKYLISRHRVVTQTGVCGLDKV